MIEIKNTRTGEVIHSGDFNNIKECAEDAVRLAISLYRADLYEADLHEADLYGADLREANLRGAELYGANLREAELREASGVRAFTAGKLNRLCFTYIYKDIQRYQIGCFNGTLDEACTAIRDEYGKGSSYERIVRAYEGGIDND